MTVIAVAALIADKKLQDDLMISEDSLLNIFLKSWQEVIKNCGLEHTSKVLRWCAYDSEFEPTKNYDTFKKWIPKGA